MICVGLRNLSGKKLSYSPMALLLAQQSVVRLLYLGMGVLRHDIRTAVDK